MKMSNVNLDLNLLGIESLLEKAGSRFLTRSTSLPTTDAMRDHYARLGSALVVVADGIFSPASVVLTLLSIPDVSSLTTEKVISIAGIAKKAWSRWKPRNDLKETVKHASFITMPLSDAIQTLKMIVKNDNFDPFDLVTKPAATKLLSFIRSSEEERAPDAAVDDFMTLLEQSLDFSNLLNLGDSPHGEQGSPSPAANALFKRIN